MTVVEAPGEIEYTRGRDFFDPDEQQHAHVTIVGCGGIGSFTAHALAKLGISHLTMVDFDSVEAHNVPNQLFTREHVGYEKAHVLSMELASTTNADLDAYTNRLTEDGWEDPDNIPPLHGIVISALDNMAARQWLWEQVRMRYPVSLFLDGRLGGQNIVTYAVNPVDLDDIRGYEATLHSDAEGLDMPCTGRNIIDVGYAMAALMARHVRGHLNGESPPAITFQDQGNLTLAKSGWLL